MPEPRCIHCTSLRTCVHDDACVHGLYFNRQPCKECLDSAPKTNMEIATAEYNLWRMSNRLPPVPAKLPTTLRSFALSEKAYIGLLHIADDLQYRMTTGRPNVNQLLETIGQGLLIVASPGANVQEDLSPQPEPTD